MTDETARPATAPEVGRPVPAAQGVTATGDASFSEPRTANSEQRSASTADPSSAAPGSPDTGPHDGRPVGQPRTTMTDSVVAKIAGIAAAGVPGVHRLGGPLERALDGVRRQAGDAVRALGVPTGDQAPDSHRPDRPSAVPDPERGVEVEVGEREAAVSLEVTVDFGASVPGVASAVRREVAAAVERMTDLQVREVDVRVSDVHVPDAPDAADPGDETSG